MRAGVVWDDPVALMNYVTAVFREVLRILNSAEELMMRYTLADGQPILDEVRRHRGRRHGDASYGLQATLERGQGIGAWRGFGSSNGGYASSMSSGEALSSSRRLASARRP